MTPRCPHCLAPAAPPDGVCPRCGRAAADAIAAGPAPRAASVGGAVRAGPPPVLSNDTGSQEWANLFADGPAAAAEVERLRARLLSASWPARVHPLPAAARGWVGRLGLPLASARFGDDSMGVAFVTAIGLLLLGSACLVGGLVRLAMGGADVALTALGPLLLSVAMLALAAWLALRRPAPRAAVWACADGVVWQEGTRVRCCAWDEVGGLFVTARAGGLHVRLRLGESELELSEAATDIGTLVEARASAALLPVVLRRLAHGETVKLGELELSRQGIRHRRTFAAWRDVTAVNSDGFWITIDHVRKPGLLTIHACTVSFLEVALAASRVLLRQPPGGEP